MKANFIKFIILSVFFLSCASNKPKVLIIGDSISMGYLPNVKKQLSKSAQIYHNPGNAQHTWKGLKNIEEWVKKEQWDVIQFNWGLWDMCYRVPSNKNIGEKNKTKGKLTTDIDQYSENIDSLVTLIKRYRTAKLIFVTTTHVPAQDSGRYPLDIIKYNNAAKKVMLRHSVLTNDIHEQSVVIHSSNGKGINDAHYTDAGYEKLAFLVSHAIKVQLNKGNMTGTRSEDK